MEGRGRRVRQAEPGHAGGPRVQVGGPTGAFVVVIFNVIALHGYDGLLIATLLAGLILILAGVFRLGQIIKYVPHPVVTGFTAGIAVIIASSQVKDFLGLSIDEVPADFVPKWQSYLGAVSTIDVATVAVGVGALAIIIAVQQLEGNVFYPIVVGRKLALHPVGILLALTAGGVLAGVAGAFLAMPVVAIAGAVLQLMRERREEREAAAVLAP